MSVHESILIISTHHFITVLKGSNSWPLFNDGLVNNSDGLKVGSFFVSRLLFACRGFPKILIFLSNYVRGLENVRRRTVLKTHSLTFDLVNLLFNEIHIISAQW